MTPKEEAKQICEYCKIEITKYGCGCGCDTKEPKQDLEKEMFELEQELNIPSHLRWHNSKPKQKTLPKQETLEEAFDISILKEYLLDFVDWQNRCSKWVTIPESMVDDYLDWKKFKNK